MGAFLRLPLLTSADVVTARRHTIDVARDSGMTSLEQTMLATVVSGLARRRFASTGRGEVVFSANETSEGRLNLVVEVFDTGTVREPEPEPDTDPGSAETTPTGHTRSLDCGDLQLVLDHGTAAGGSHYVSAAVLLSEDSTRDLNLRERLGTLHSDFPGADSGSVELSARVAALSEELAILEALVASVSADRAAANAELALTNRGVLDLVAELAAANESLVASTAEMRQLADQHTALAQLGHRAVASRDLDRLAAGLVRELARVLGIQSVGVLRFAPDKVSLDVVASEGCSPGQPTSIDVTSAQSRHLRGPGSLTGDPSRDATDILLEVPGETRSWAVVPVHTPAGPWGVLVVCDPAEGRFIETAITFIEAAVSLFASAIARKASEDTVRHFASHDGLTGLPNRSRLLDDLAGMLVVNPSGESVVTQDGPEAAMAVIFIDIDKFKQVNDTLGHAAGDLILVAVTERLQKCARPDDVLARLGGDEFVVLCKGGGPAAPVIAKRLLSAFDEPFDIEGQEMFLSASAGISLAEAGVTPGQLLADADIAMYRAKMIPGSTTVAFHPDMRVQAAAESRLHNELRRAQQRGQLRAAFQPIIDLNNGQVRGVEALLRWRHPELGDVPADVAVAAAEKIGIAWDLTCWIAREAATTVHAWNSANSGHAPLRLAVNFTPLLLDDPSRVAELTSIVLDAGLPIHLLDVELTETAFTDPNAAVLASMTALREIGARLAIDDFGTGYSSLMALSNLPLDVLKIDRSFVSPLDVAGHSVLVSAMTDIARGCGLETIAEGIETEAQLAAVMAAGCDLGQGYLFARPLEVEQLWGLVSDEFRFADLVRKADSAGASTQRMHAGTPT